MKISDLLLKIVSIGAAGPLGKTPALHAGKQGSIPWRSTLNSGRNLLRDRLTVGRDTLNVVVLVQIQLSHFHFSTEVIRLDEEPVLKTGDVSTRL